MASELCVTKKLNANNSVYIDKWMLDVLKIKNKTMIKMSLDLRNNTIVLSKVGDDNNGKETK